MNKVYLMYAINEFGEYSGPVDSVEYVADSKDEITRLANNYIREDLGFDDWKDKTYEEFNDVVEVDDTHAIRVEEFPLYTGFNVKYEGEWQGQNESPFIDPGIF